MKKIYDVIIVGAGPSGIGVASILKQMNASYLYSENKLACLCLEGFWFN